MACDDPCCRQNEELLLLLPQFAHDVQESILLRWPMLDQGARERVLADLREPQQIDSSTLITLAAYFRCDVDDLIRYIRPDHDER